MAVMSRKAMLYAAGALAFGIVALVLWTIERSRLDIQKQGTSVEGLVTRSWVTKGAHRTSREEHLIDYTYTVNGAAFKGEERRVSGPLGGHLKVWYDAKAPGRCVSDPELRYGPEFEGIFMMGLFGLVALVGAVREFFRRNA